MISLLCPTRRRPGNVVRLWESAKQTAGDRFELLLYVDNDDTPTLNLLERAPANIRPIIGERIVLSEMWNRLAEHARSDVMMHCGDDIVFRTPWHDQVLEAFDRFDDRICFVHGRDGFHDERFGTHGWLHRRWVDTVGYFVPPYFSSDYNDTWLNDVANMLDRRVYLPEVYTEHLHPNFAKAPWDATHRERLERHQRDNVDQLYASLAAERNADAGKLREAIDGFDRVHAG